MSGSLMFFRLRVKSRPPSLLEMEKPGSLTLPGSPGSLPRPGVVLSLTYIVIGNAEFAGQPLAVPATAVVKAGV
jgi:hypothetical protein